jgi:hypothetical protein
MDIFSSSSISYSSSDQLYDELYKHAQNDFTTTSCKQKKLSKKCGASVEAHALQKFRQTPWVRHVESRLEEDMVIGGARG